jgi:hypothetical protein
VGLSHPSLAHNGGQARWRRIKFRCRWNTWNFRVKGQDREDPARTAQRLSADQCAHLEMDMEGLGRWDPPAVLLSPTHHRNTLTNDADRPRFPATPPRVAIQMRGLDLQDEA